MKTLDQIWRDHGAESSGAGGTEEVIEDFAREVFYLGFVACLEEIKRHTADPEATHDSLREAFVTWNRDAWDRIFELKARRDGRMTAPGKRH